MRSYTITVSTSIQTLRDLLPNLYPTDTKPTSVDSSFRALSNGIFIFTISPLRDWLQVDFFVDKVLPRPPAEYTFQQLSYYMTFHCIKVWPVRKMQILHLYTYIHSLNR